MEENPLNVLSYQNQVKNSSLMKKNQFFEFLLLTPSLVIFFVTNKSRQCQGKVKAFFPLKSGACQGRKSGKKWLKSARSRECQGEKS